MSKTLKEKLYEYEAVPPQGIWEGIAAALDGEAGQQDDPPTLPPPKKGRLLIFITLAAASAAIVIVCFLVFRNTTKTNVNEVAATNSYNSHTTLTSKDKNNTPVNLRHDAILQVPVEEDSLEKSKDDQLLASNNPKTEVGPSERTSDENNTNDDKTKASDLKKQAAKSLKQHTYITITGADGQPVKISSKVASLLVLSDENSTPDPEWNKKLLQWKNAMQSNTLAATPGNFLDIVELTNTLTDN